jgi:hypothetical protein
MTLHWLVERAIATCVVLAASSGPPQLLEDPAARAHFEEAQERFESRDYAGAAAALDAAYAIEPAADLLYPWAQAERLDGNCRRAIELYRRFLAANPPQEHAMLAEQNIATCEDQLARQRSKEPGPQPADPATDTRRTTDQRPWRRDVAGGVLVGAGSAGLVVGTGLLIAALHGASSAAEADDVADYEERMDRATLQRNLSIGAFVAGGALALGGVLRYVLVARKQRTSVGLLLDPSAVGLVLTTRL